MCQSRPPTSHLLLQLRQTTTRHHRKILGEQGDQLKDYRVVSLVDAQDEDKLGEEECSSAVIDYTRLVGLHGSQAQEEDDGQEEEAQRHSSCAPCQDLDGQDLSVLMQIIMFSRIKSDTTV